MSILQISHLTHIYDSKILFEDAELSINNGEHVGIVGLNGAGKTTFLNIICGKIVQDAGEIKWHPSLKRGYLDQHADIDRTKSVMEYLRLSFQELFRKNEEMETIYANMAELTDMDEIEKMIQKAARIMEELEKRGFFELDATIKKVAGGLGVSAFGYDTPISNLSGGQRAKVMLARLLLDQPDCMLLDEPTNFLDVEHVEWLTKYLCAYKGTVIVVSHETEFLNSVCNFIVNIENKTIKKYSGNYKQFQAQYESVAKQYAESYERQQRDIKKMEDYIARNKARASTAGMAGSRQKMLDRMERLDKPIEFGETKFHFPYNTLSTKELLVVKNLEIGYSHALLPPISFLMGSQNKLWIRGANGIGKSTFLKTLVGSIKAISGTFLFNINTKTGYMKQDGELEKSDETAVSYLNEQFPRLTQKEIRTKLGAVGIKGELATKALRNMSGGEQVRVSLCVIMQKQTNLLILDEPTNHLDVKAKQALKDALIAYQGALILVTHESEFAKGLCDMIFDVENNVFKAMN